MNTFGLNRPVYSFGLGLVLVLIDTNIPPGDGRDQYFYPTDCRSFLATECERNFVPTDIRKFKTE